MHLGYNTNGLAHHSLPAAIKLLAELGYRSAAITLDHAGLNPFADQLAIEIDETKSLLAKHDLRSVVETGARYLLDPMRKHHPTLVSTEPQDRARRIDFLRRAVGIAAELDSDCVSLWSGALPPGDSREFGMGRLTEGLVEVLEYAEQRDVVLGFEPEPGMLIDTMDAYGELFTAINSTRLKLTLDVGHLYCQGELPIADFIRRWGEQIVNVHIEDMRAGIHEHLMFGEGEMDFPPIVTALAEVGYDGGLHVELSRHSHVGPIAARQAHDFLQPIVDASRDSETTDPDRP